MANDFLPPDHQSGFSDKATLEKEAFFQESALIAPLLGPYSSFATGLGFDVEGLFVSVVLVYDSPEEAKNDITVLQKRLVSGMNSKHDLWKKEVEYLRSMVGR